MTSDIEIRAAGGVVWRFGMSGKVEVLIVHRPRQGYDDWTFPKGKTEPDDGSIEATAIREVNEETGFDVALGDRVATVHYRDQSGRSKEVCYFLMTITGGEFTVNDEVDEARWMTLRGARILLSYESDRQVVDTVVALVAAGAFGSDSSGQ
ncbi:MAG: NUDIX hydrolase [Acidimicrobiia bacterium]